MQELFLHEGTETQILFFFVIHKNKELCTVIEVGETEHNWLQSFNL